MQIDQKEFFGIGVYNPKFEVNLGTLWRSAYNLGASYVFTVGRRKFVREHSDTIKTWKQLPVFTYSTMEEFLNNRPFSTPLIGVELAEGSHDLRNFCHLQTSTYILGPEDGSLPKEIQGECRYIVEIPSKYCLNLAVAGSIVMYDRLSKNLKKI